MTSPLTTARQYDTRDRLRDFQQINYPILWGGQHERLGLWAGETPTPQEIVEYFFICQSLTQVTTKNVTGTIFSDFKYTLDAIGNLLLPNLIMWTQIDTHISQVTGEKFQSQQRRSVGGGCINEGYAVSNGDRTYFVKQNQASQVAMFEAEALGLKEMLATASIRVPKPICWGTADNSSYIVLEWLELGGGNSNSWQEMGRKLAAMHKASSSQGFGWKINNTIGSTPQINTWTADWTEFYIKHRLGYQFQLARRRGANFSQQDKLLAAIPELLANHQVQPSLVHGDLWGGNAGCTASGEPVIFDPATYFADREVDIAMTELFGGFPAAFYKGYNEVFPLDAGYEQRKTLYNLYHILNHFNLFGGGYDSQANRMIDQILR